MWGSYRYSEGQYHARCGGVEGLSFPNGYLSLASAGSILFVNGGGYRVLMFRLLLSRYVNSRGGLRFSHDGPLVDFPFFLYYRQPNRRLNFRQGLVPFRRLCS